MGLAEIDYIEMQTHVVKLVNLELNEYLNKEVFLFHFQEDSCWTDTLCWSYLVIPGGATSTFSWDLFLPNARSSCVYRSLDSCEARW